MINLLFDEANSSDIVGIQTLYDQIDGQHHSALPHIFKPTQEIARPDSYIENIIEKSDACFLVARSQNELVGFVNVEVRKTQHPLINVFEYGHISDIVIASEWKRQGIGKQLIKEAHKWLRKNQMTEVTLTVFSFNKEAISFYESIGYCDRNITMAYAFELDEST